MKLSNDIVAFAAGNTDFYEAMSRYFQFENERTAENTHKLNDAWFAEVERKSGVSREGIEHTAWMAHPAVKWASMAIVDATINAIIPVTILPQFGMFADFRTAGYGDIMKVKIQPKQFYTVSLGGRGERTSFRQKHFAQDVVVAPIEHIVTVYVDMYRVLAGKEDIAEAIRLVIMSVEQAMYSDAIGALTTGLGLIGDPDLNVSGAFDMKTLVKMAEKIQVLNAGVRPVIVGSAVALMNVLPDSSLGYRVNVDGNGGAIQLIRNVMGYDVMRLEPALASNGSLALPDNKIFVVSPAQDKLIKGIMSLALNNSNEFYDNADLTQNFTYRKGWNFIFATAASAGIYEITE